MTKIDGAKSWPLELILRHNGSAELVDANDVTLWASDTDQDFREEFSDEFLSEDDLDDILSYLCENEIVTDEEAAKFEEGDFETYEESLPGEDDETDEENEEDAGDED